MDFWILISDAHQQKLRKRAESYGVSIKEALEKIVALAKNDNITAGNPAFPTEIATGEHIERMIDVL